LFYEWWGGVKSGRKKNLGWTGQAVIPKYSLFFHKIQSLTYLPLLIYYIDLKKEKGRDMDCGESFHLKANLSSNISSSITD
jgi:hypothetical protein